MAQRLLCAAPSAQDHNVSRARESHPRDRVTGGGHPPPVPTERGVRISRTNALRKLVHSTASACSSEYGRRSLGGSNGVRSLIWLKVSQVRRRPAQLRLHNIRRQ